jgi:P22 coat protein - gene protein 5
MAYPTVTSLTPTAVTRKALMILHQKLTFIGSINREYDDSFAKSGAKIGDTLKVRLPNKYKTFTGLDQTANFQDTPETSIDVKVQKIRSLPLKFDDWELTLGMDDFSSRVIEPAMAQMAADIEADVLSTAYADVYQQVGTAGTIPNTLKILNQSRAKLTDSLTPSGERSMILNTDAQVEIVDAVKGLFHDSSKVSKQYRDGIMGTTAGFGDIYETTQVPVHTNGTATGAHTVTAPPVEGSSVINITGTGTQIIRKGTVFTVAGVFMVHSETKVNTGKLQQFVVTADATAVAGAYTAVSVSPAFIASATNPRQNISALPAGAAVVTLVGAASTSFAQNLAYHKDAFTFVTADLSEIKGAAFHARESYDGISMRLWRDWDIKTGLQFSRLDIAYGFKTIRPEMACRITA